MVPMRLLLCRMQDRFVAKKMPRRAQRCVSTSLMYDNHQNSDITAFSFEPSLYRRYTLVGWSDLAGSFLLYAAPEVNTCLYISDGLV